jgi:hypothetical protein
MQTRRDLKTKRPLHSDILVTATNYISTQPEMEKKMRFGKFLIAKSLDG